MRQTSASVSLLPAGVALALALGASPTLASAQGTDTPTVRVGDPAPDFTLEDARGVSYRLSEMVKNGPVVLEFFRSGDW